MIKLLRSICLVAIIAVAVSCSKDDPLPRATVDFTNKVTEVGVEVMFDNLTLNADRYEWSFSDGQTSDAISPTMIFDEPGDLEVVLRAFTKDGQKDTLARNITIRQRYLVAYAVNVFPLKNGAVEWDPGEADPADAFPDIFVQLTVNKSGALTQAEIDNSLFDGPFENVNIPSFFVDVTQDVILKKYVDGWGFAIFDFEENDPATTADDDFIFMAGVGFDPILSPTVKSTDGESGFITIFSPGDGTNPAFGVDLFFELR